MRDIQSIFFVFWKNLVFENTSFLGFSYNESHVSTNERKRLFYIGTSSKISITSCNFVYNSTGFINVFIYLNRVVTIDINGTIFKCINKPFLRVSALNAISPNFIELRGNSFENFAFFTTPIDIIESNGLIAIIGVASYTWDTNFIVTAKIYSNNFINMESTVLNGVLGLLNIHELNIFNNNFTNCKAYRGGGLSILFSLKAIINTTRFLNCSSLADGGAVTFQ